MEFSVALDRVLVLLKADKIDKRFAFIKTAEPLLKLLNRLRNRLLHAGTFVLHSRPSTNWSGRTCFPFVKQVTTLPEYSKHEAFWKYKRLKCGIDPMEVIAADWQKGEYDLKKVAC